MRFLVDAQLPPALARWLSARGHEATHVLDHGLLEARDVAIQAEAQLRGAVLKGGTIYACRSCYQLTYLSQRESAVERGQRQAERIRQRLSWEKGVLHGNGRKPQGMHWRTFERIWARHEA